MKYTRLHSNHEKLGAKMIEFFGWRMPVEYKGIIDEHLAVRLQAGLFDVSHMGEIYVNGPDSLAFLQHLTPNDVSRLAPGQVQYTALTTPQGTFVDDMLVYCLEPERYLLVVNASNADKDYAWVVRHAPAFKVKTENVSESYSQLALQGPKAEQILQPLTALPLAGMKSFTSAWGKVVGEEALVSRTGYTGEDGFEIYLPPQRVVALWDALLEAGTPRGLRPCGLGARDTLRLEAKMALYGNDIDDQQTVLEADLGWIVKLQKGEFIGREALARQKAEGIARKLVGFEVTGRGIARSHYPILAGGARIGEVTSGAPSPWLNKNIGLGYVAVGHAAVGTLIEILIRDQPVAARIVQTPFYKRTR